MYRNEGRDVGSQKQKQQNSPNLLKKKNRNVKSTVIAKETLQFHLLQY